MIDILIDVDGVLADFVAETLDALVAVGGPRMSSFEMTQWDLLPQMPEEFRSLVAAAWKSKGFCERIMPYPNAQAAATILSTIGRVHYVTAHFPGSDHWLQERMQWLRTHFKARDVDVTFTHRKHGNRGDMLIDDKPRHAVEWANAHPLGQGVLWAQPYNVQHEPLPSNVIRTNDWEVVFSIARGMIRPVH